MKAVVVALALLLGACGPAAPAMPDPETAARIAWKITMNPGSTDRILKRNELTRSEYEALLFTIAEDEDRSRKFEAGLLAAEQDWHRAANQTQK